MQFFLGDPFVGRIESTKNSFCVSSYFPFKEKVGTHTFFRFTNNRLRNLQSKRFEGHFKT
ncbi:hypothetical protein A0128_14685 [Leptospira tipperaryensis]|uniref:Uncharacterized protein n=1 Tax=Leptospira tipperaryensis TaxID=2564040 RepID=A0A1D7UZG6_9LEPT|nr:hypothetical protein A0128_14685 [Leptospira tipperaryensis]